MLIKVKDKEGNIYTNNMSKSNDKSILEIHFCTSYTQVVVQDTIVNDEGVTIYSEKDIIIPLENPNWADMIAVDDNEIGEWA